MHNISVLTAAFIMDHYFGQPISKYHPVKWLGCLIDKLETKLYRDSILYGAFFFIVVNLISVLTAVSIIVVSSIFGKFIYFIMSLIIVYCCFTINGLIRAAKKIYDDIISSNLEAARVDLKSLVSRNTEDISHNDIICATIESIAENSVDSIIAPLFYTYLFSVIGAAIYRTVNTLDAMIGYKNERYIMFGRVSARADDVLNYIPARLSVILIAFAGKIKGRPFWSCVRASFRDARKRVSPNAGYPESAFALTLGIRLGGKVKYHNKESFHPFINEGGETPEPEHIKSAIELLKTESIVFILGVMFIEICSIILLHL